MFEKIYSTEEIKTIIRDYKLEDKRLLMPTMRQSNEFVRMITVQGVSSINLRKGTLENFARELAARSVEKGARLIKSDDGQFFYAFKKCLTKLLEGGKLSYFNEINITDNIVESLLKTINEMRMTEKECGDLEVVTINPRKKEDLQLIIKEYNQLLSNHKVIDLSDIYTHATTYFKSNPHKYIFLFPVDLFYSISDKNTLPFLTSKESAFLNALTNHNNSQFYPFYLIEDRSKALDNTQLFSCFGEINEVRNIFRKINKQNIKLDDVAIYTTAIEPYSQHIYNEAKKLEIPITNAKGIGYYNSPAGKFIDTYFDWCLNGYKVNDLLPLFIEGYLKVDDKEEIFSNAWAVRFLSKCEIGWGDKERYIKRIKNKEIDEQKDPKIVIKRELLLELVEDLFINQDADNKIAFPDVINHVIELIRKYAKPIRANMFTRDAAKAKREIIEKLTEMQHWFNDNDKMPLEEAIEIVRSNLKKLRVNRNSSNSGAIYVDQYHNGAITGRKHVFVVGLDIDRYPGKMLEDPFLLDEERKNIDDSDTHTLLTVSEVINHKRHSMANILASANEHLYLSHSNYDTVQMREKYPALLFIDINDKTNCKEQKVSFVPEDESEILSYTDWLLSIDNKAIKKIIKTRHQHLQNGMDAMEQRQQKGFTTFDGNVKGITSDKIINIGTKGNSISPSSLTDYIKCPFRYYLKNLLYCKVNEEDEYSINKWLNILDEGTLLHSIFEKCIEHMKEHGQVEDKEMESIVVAEVQAIAEKSPCPNEFLYKQTLADAMKQATNFLHYEKILQEEYSTISTEEGFEDRQIGNMDIYVKGKIDRIDKHKSENSYKILDYKTGKYKSAEDINKELEKGTMLQHYLYAEAFKSNLPDADIVSGYYYTKSEKMDNLITFTMDEMGTAGSDVVEKAIKDIRAGNFVFTGNNIKEINNKNGKCECKYCPSDVKLTCKLEMLQEVYENKIDTDSDEGSAK